MWTDNAPLELNKQHHIALAWDTFDGGNNCLHLWLDGQQKFNATGLNLWTGNTYPKFGIYRGEKAAKGDNSLDEEHVFDSFVYRVQVSDASLDEIKEAGGL
jgi:hypothetical protein